MRCGGRSPGPGPDMSGWPRSGMSVRLRAHAKRAFAVLILPFSDWWNLPVALGHLVDVSSTSEADVVEAPATSSSRLSRRVGRRWCVRR